MTNGVETRAYQLFLQALQASEEERKALLSSTDAEVGRLALSMLDDYEQTHGQSSQRRAIKGLWSRDPTGTTIDGWRIHEQIGYGGYGRVFRATRAAPQARLEAAIKFLSLAPFSVPRFLRERQILADLDHPGICKFLDGGTTEDGLPYLVMEYVSGMPITAYCDYHRKTISDRLRLFVELCRAVEYAHANRVLHRDLKPANILVTASGTVRVLDFGVATLLSANVAERLTKPGEAPWTKAYASPEQVKGERHSLATDVYALGVILYELLTGELPFSTVALSSPDWMTVLLERLPLPPSQALAVENAQTLTALHAPETTSSRRRSPASRLKRVLRGNLDAVVLKSLAKDPLDRYRRVDQFRSDIEQFLDGQPVTARKCGFWERARNWARRRPVTAALVTFALVFWFVAANVAVIAKSTEAELAIRAAADAKRRIRYLSGGGLQAIERVMPKTSQTTGARMTVLRIHSDMLRQIMSMPESVIDSMGTTVAQSALDCTREWRSLGRFSEAMDATEQVLPRTAAMVRTDARDPRWRDLYADLLRARIEIRGALGQRAEMMEELNRLTAIEGGAQKR